MANSSGVVGVLRALLTADTAQFDTSMRKAVTTTQKTTTALGGLGKEVQKLTPQAERMAKAFGGDRLIASANNLTAAVTKIGGASKLTEAEQRRVNATVTEAIAKYKALGVQAPKDMLAIAAATRQTASASSILSSSFATLTASFSAAALITGATTALTGFVREAINGAGALVDLSGKTGLSTETLQRMGFVADQVGATLEDFTNASFQLGVRVAAGATTTRKAFDDLKQASDALVISFEQFQTLSPDEKFKLITTALHEVQDEQERNRIGVALMGRQYANIAAAVAENYNEMAKAAKVSTDAQIHAIDDAVDAWQAFVKSTTTSVQAAIGNVILFNNAMAAARERLAARGNTLPNEAELRAEAQFILEQGLLKAREKNIDITEKAGKALVSYIAILKQLEGQLGSLTAADHREIDAALKVGATAEDLAPIFERVGIAGDDVQIALSLLKSEMRESSAAAKDLGRDWAELAELQARAFGLDKVHAAEQMVNAIGGMAGVVLMDADAQRQLNALLNDAIDAAERNGQIVPLEWLRIEEATNRNVGTIQDYLKLVNELPEAMRAIPPPPELIPFKSELDTKRTIDLLTQNAPGTEIGKFKEAGGIIGDTMGGEMKKKLLNAFEDIPHFLTSSVLHSGNFLNGLKALGVSMADAIVEPLLKEFAKKLAGAKIAGAVAGGAGAVLGGSAAAAGTVAAEVGGTAAATTAAVGGGGGVGASIVAFATNPFTLAAVGAAVGGALLFRHFRRGQRGNDVRDKDLAQFAGFDTAADRRDMANPPGFHGLDRLLSKHKQHALFPPFITAKDPDAVRKAFAPIQAFVGSLGRRVKSFQGGTANLDYQNFGPATTAELHGEEAVIPKGKGHRLAEQIAAVLQRLMGRPFTTSGSASAPQLSARLAGHTPLGASLSRWASIPPLNLSGFSAPSVAMSSPAMLASAASDVAPPAAAPVTRNTYITIEGLMDAGNFTTLLREHGFREIKRGVFLNEQGLATTINRVKP